MCVLRVELGVRSRGKLGAVEMVSEYIAHNQAEEVTSLTRLLVISTMLIMSALRYLMLGRCVVLICGN